MRIFEEKSNDVERGGGGRVNKFFDRRVDGQHVVKRNLVEWERVELELREVVVQDYSFDGKISDAWVGFCGKRDIR